VIAKNNLKKTYSDIIFKNNNWPMVVQPNMFQLKTVTVHNVKFAQKQMYSPFTVTNTM
jgi:hypothetical protein